MDNGQRWAVRSQQCGSVILSTQLPSLEPTQLFQDSSFLNQRKEKGAKDAQMHKNSSLLLVHIP